jgi:hypothetical protein
MDLPQAFFFLNAAMLWAFVLASAQPAFSQTEAVRVKCVNAKPISSRRASRYLATVRTARIRCNVCVNPVYKQGLPDLPCDRGYCSTVLFSLTEISSYQSHGNSASIAAVSRLPRL